MCSKSGENSEKIWYPNPANTQERSCLQPFVVDIWCSHVQVDSLAPHAVFVGKAKRPSA